MGKKKNVIHTFDMTISDTTPDNESVAKFLGWTDLRPHRRSGTFGRHPQLKSFCALPNFYRDLDGLSDGLADQGWTFTLSCTKADYTASLVDPSEAERIFEASIHSTLLGYTIRVIRDDSAAAALFFATQYLARDLVPEQEGILKTHHCGDR